MLLDERIRQRCYDVAGMWIRVKPDEGVKYLHDKPWVCRVRMDVVERAVVALKKQPHDYRRDRLPPCEFINGFFQVFSKDGKNFVSNRTSDTMSFIDVKKIGFYSSPHKLAVCDILYDKNVETMEHVGFVGGEEYVADIPNPGYFRYAPLTDEQTYLELREAGRDLAYHIQHDKSRVIPNYYKGRPLLLEEERHKRDDEEYDENDRTYGGKDSHWHINYGFSQKGLFDEIKKRVLETGLRMKELSTSFEVFKGGRVALLMKVYPGDDNAAPRIKYFKYSEDADFIERIIYNAVDLKAPDVPIGEKPLFLGDEDIVPVDFGKENRKARFERKKKKHEPDGDDLDDSLFN